MQSRRGNCTINGTWTNSSHQLTDLTFNNHIKSCDEVFNQQTQEITEAMKARARMLINNCFYVKKPNGETVFKFLNGLEVIQLPNGHTEFVTFCHCCNSLKFS